MMMRSLAATMLVLASSAAVAEPEQRDTAERSADSGDKMICKRFVETGSLVKRYKTCKTKRDWERERDALRSVNNINSCTKFGEASGCS